MMYKVGIVGCGLAAGKGARRGTGPNITHIEALLAHPKFNVVGAYDNDAGAVQDYCQEWGLSGFLSLNALFDERPDILLLAASTNSHEHLLKVALQSEIKFVVCEKPLVKNVQTAREIIEAFKSENRSLLVYYPRRWISELTEIEAQIGRGDFGKFMTGHAYYGNGILNICSHAFDLILRLIGNVRSVECFDRSHFFSNEEDPTASLILTMEGRSTLILQAYDYSKYAGFEIDLFYENGRIRLSDLGFELDVFKKAKSKRYPEFYELNEYHNMKTDYGNAASKMWNEVSNYMGSDTHSVDDKDTIILAVVDASMRAIRSGEVVYV